MIGHYILFALLIIVIVIADKVFNEGNKYFYFNLKNLFIVSFVMYTVLPVFDCIINEKYVEYIPYFMIDSILLMLFVIFGFLISKKFESNKQIKYNRKKISAKKQRLLTVFFGGLCTFFLMLNIYVNRGGLSNFLHTSYTQSYSQTVNNNIGFLMFALQPYTLIFMNKKAIPDVKSRRITFAFTMFFIAMNFLGGNRNYAVMSFFALIISVFEKIRIRKIVVYLGVIIGTFLMGILAVFREFGVVNALNGNIPIGWDKILKYAISFSDGELGTMLKFTIYKTKVVEGFAFPYSYGYSYFILPIINLIPYSIYPNKPIAYADYFSKNAFGVFTGEGFGFSPIYEAQINFGILWPAFFILVGFLISRSIKYEKYAISSYSLIGIIILNFYRIDFTTCFKFFAMMFVFRFIFAIFLFRRKCIKVKTVKTKKMLLHKNYLSYYQYNYHKSCYYFKEKQLLFNEKKEI